MLLVDDDEPNRAERREDGRAGADDHVDLAAPDAMPLIVALAIGQAAVLDGHPLADVWRKTSATAGVKAISGTSRSTPRPRRRSSAARRR